MIRDVDSEHGLNGAREKEKEEEREEGSEGEGKATSG